EEQAVEGAKNKTFGDCAELYLKAHRDDFKNAKHVQQWERSLRVDCKPIAHVPVAMIEEAHVLQVLEPIWKKKPESASRTRGRMERVIAAAMAAKYRKREAGNPARWDGTMKSCWAPRAQR